MARAGRNTPGRQRGIAMVVIVAGLLAILAVAGLALDASHITYNKSRLQAVVDTTALTAAKVLDQTGSATQATAAANAVFQANIASFPELRRALGASATPVIAYSKQVSPFTAEPASTLGLHYARVSVANFAAGAGLLRLVGVQTLPVRASAIAGPSPAVGFACNVVPIALCGVGNGNGALGYPADKVHAINSGSGTTPGFYRFLQFDDTGGADAVRHNIAGGYNQCLAVGTRVPIKSGVNSGPVVSGVNSRFNQYSSNLLPARYPPDVIQREPSPRLTYDPKTGQIRQNGNVVTLVSQLDFAHAGYVNATRNGPYDIQPSPVGMGVFKRRVVAAPVVNCADEVSRTVPVLGLRCLYLLQRADQAGADARLFVEIAPECEAGGRPGPVPPGSPGGVYIIELYRDPASPDS